MCQDFRRHEFLERNGRPG